MTDPQELLDRLERWIQTYAHYKQGSVFVENTLPLIVDCRDALARVSQPQPNVLTLDGLPQVTGRCLVLLRDEQEKPSPDNAIVAALCDAVRMKRELVDLYQAARVSVPTEPPQKECFCNHETRRPDGLSQRDSGNGPASSAGGDIAGLNAGQRASIPVDGAIPSESLPLQDPPSTIGPPWWCATCDSWRHTMPCGRDECPHPSNSLQEKRHMEIPSEANVPPNIVDAAEMLWVVLANVSGGDWTQQTPEWQEVAARWRDYYFKAVDPERPESPLAVGVAPPPQEQPEVNDSLATIEVNDLTHDDACLLSRIFNADSDLVQIDQYGRINDFLKRTIETTGTAKDRDRCVCPDCGQGFAFDFKLKRVTCGCPASPRRSPTRSRKKKRHERNRSSSRPERLPRPYAG